MYKTKFMPQRVFTLQIHSALYTRAPWLVSMSEHVDPEFSFRLGPAMTAKHGITTQVSSPPDIIEDVFKVRDRVFGVRRPEDAMELFKEFGPWQLTKEFDKEGIKIRFSAVLRRRNHFEQALLDRSVENLDRAYSERSGDIVEGLENIYLWQPLPMHLVFGDPPVARVRCKDIEDALRSSVVLDRLDGFVWRRCQREDCGALYKLTSKRRKLFCKSECAHLQSVRDYHERKRNSQLTPSKRKSKAKVVKRRKGL
jgi:hypothetical protein